MRAIAGLSAALVLAGAGGALAQEVTDWSGFYASVHAGYALDPTRAASTTNVIPVPPLGGFAGTITATGANSRIDGIFGGLGVGYNFQHSQFVLGVDGTISAGGLGKSHSVKTDVISRNGADFVSVDSLGRMDYSVDWYTSLTAKFGVAFDDGWMGYVRGGLAVANVSVAGRATSVLDGSSPAVVNAVAGVPPISEAISSSSEQLMMGPKFGLGVDKMVTQNVSLGVSYDYVSLPDVVTTGLYTPVVGNGIGPRTFAGGFHTLKASVKYHF